MKPVEQTFDVKGITCAGCARTIEKTLSTMPGVENVKVATDPPLAYITVSNGFDIKGANQALSRVGSYELLTNPPVDAQPLSLTTEKGSYFPLVLIFTFLSGATALAQLHLPAPDMMLAMKHFMGGFFLVFSFFKLLDLKGFSASYRRYDILAGKWPGYGYIYPFLELALGIAFLSPVTSPLVLWATLVLMSMSAVGVARTLIRGDRIQCACLGTVFNLPMSTVTLVEDLLMVVMAGVMLIFK